MVLLIPFINLQWYPPPPLEVNPPAEPGSRSTERETQLERERHILQTIYFTRESIPFTPEEPDKEDFVKKEPIQIPIRDVRLTLLKELCFAPPLSSNSLYFTFTHKIKVFKIVSEKVVAVILTNLVYHKYVV